jgi:hypothetical protein
MCKIAAFEHAHFNYPITQSPNYQIQYRVP